MTKKIQTQEVKDALNNLVALTKKFDELMKTGYKGINYFQASSMGAQEIKHSSFIAWLLDPDKEHGFKDKMLKMFFKILYGYKPEQYGEIIDGKTVKSNAEIILDAKEPSFKITSESDFMDLLKSEVTILTEEVIVDKKSRIDILIDLPDTQTVVIIENKIHSDTHTDQLRRYQEEIDKPKSKYSSYKKKIFVYLAPNGELPKNRGGDEKFNNEYCILSYEDILAMIDELIKDLDGGKTALNSKDKIKMKNLLEDYKEMADIEVLAKNADVRKACKEILKDKNYKLAFELLKTYTDNAYEILSFSIEWLKAELPGVEVLNKINKYSVNFYTPTLKAFYKDEEMTTQKTYRFGSEGGNVLKFFIILERNKKREWSVAQKKIISTELQDQLSVTKSFDFITWEQRQMEFNDDFKNKVLIPKLNEIKNIIIDNDSKLAKL